MRKRWVYAIQLVLSLVIITMLAVGCAGSPSASTPGSVTTPPSAPSSKSTPTLLASTSSKTELFNIPTSFDTLGRTAELRVVKEWHGTESTVIKYTPEYSPWAINASYIPTSKIQSSLVVLLAPSSAIGKSLEGIEYHKAVRIMDIIELWKVGERKYGKLIVSYEPMEIKVEASGCEWTIKIGVE